MEKKEIKSYLTVDEFAELISVCPRTITNMIKSGRLSAFRLNASNKSSYRIPRSEIDRLALTNLDEIIEKEVEKRLKERKK